MIVDLPFILAAVAFGFGLSLAIYRWLAEYNDWPMGHLQAQRPFVPVAIGFGCMLIALAFAAARGTMLGGWGIVLLGLLWALFWLGFFRVASQLSLLLAPVSAALLLFAWFGTPSFFHADLLRTGNFERIKVYPKGGVEREATETDPRLDTRELSRETPKAEEPTSSMFKRDLNR